MKKKLAYITTTLTALIIHAQTSQLHAEVRDVNVFMSMGKNLFKSAGNPFADWIRVILGIGGIAMLIPAAFQFMKGNRESADVFLKIGIGMLIVLILIQLFLTIII